MPDVQAPRCPDCNSPRVVWRKSRPYDAVRNYVGFLFDRLLGGSSYERAYGGPASASNAGPAAGKALEYGGARDVYEVDAESKTPKAFWRCPDCGHKGAVYDNIDELLRREAGLGSVEEDIGEAGGSAYFPKGRDEP